jgi:hypothetical protein
MNTATNIIRWVGLGLMVVGLVSVGCSLIKPTGKLEAARKDSVVAEQRLLKEGQEYAVAAGKALAREAAPSKESLAARELLNRANGAFDLVLGALLPAVERALEDLVGKLTSADPKAQAAGAEALKVRDAAAQKLAEELTRERAKVAELAAKVEAYALERDAVAKKWERAMRWVWGIAGGWIFVAFVLPVLGKAFPAVGAVATIGQAVVAPFAAGALSKTKRVLGDVVGGVEDVRSLLKTKGTISKAEADAALSEWVTEADGTAAAVDAVRRQQKHL